MLRKLLLAGLALSSPVFAADNFVVKDATGTTITKASEEISSGVQADKNVLVDSSGVPILGDVTGSPAANTIGARAKDIVTNTAAIAAALGTPLQAGGTVVVTGVATAANQSTANASLSSIDTKASSLATAANQSTANSSLSTIASQTNLAKSTTNVLDSPRAAAANRVITRTTLAEDTNTTICPTAAAVISTKIYFTAAGVGVNDDGATLTTSTAGAASTTPNWVVSAAGTYYTYDVPPTNIVTAYASEASGAGVIVCTQTLRQ